MTDELLVANLSDEEIAEIEAEISHLPDRESAAIDALMIVQRHRGWISDESLQAIARLLDMSAAKLDGIATFYNLIFRRPVGRNVVMICDSVSCYIMKAESLIEKVQEKLGIQMGETTEDDRFTLLPIVCLGACDRAPTMQINEELIGPIEPDQLDEIFARFP